MSLTTVETTVAVVGAGMSGLVAARALSRQGVEVRVLDAADRVGGRMLAETSALGSRIDLGGQWIGHDHHRFMALCDELGVTRFPMRSPAKPVVIDNDRVVAAWSPGSVAFAGALAGIETLARFPPPKRWDATPVQAWLDRIPSDRARRLLDVLVEVTSCARSDELSIAAFLALIHHQGGLSTMLKTRGGAQDTLVVEGAASLPEIIAAELGNRVSTANRVSEIRQDAAGVSIMTQLGTVRARKAVVAVPAPMTRDIVFAPALPDGRNALRRNTSMGSVYKAVAVYDDPFWRARTEAESIVLGSTAYAVFDSSPPDGPGHLCFLVGGAHAAAMHGLDTEGRKAALLSGLTSRLGQQVTNPMGWHEKSWHRDPFVGGAYTALPLLGTREGFYPFPSMPTGHIHWAGAETAAAHAGYIEGAIEAGERAANEVISVLGPG